MSTSIIKVIQKPRLSVKAQTLATIFAIVGAVVVPQLFHVLGAVSGHGTAIGETFLPMQLPIILVGLLAGPYAGAISGLFGPLLSYNLSGMPVITMLPIMMIELCAYGLFAGLLRNKKKPVIGKVLCVQISGRVIRSVAVLLAVYAFGNESIRVASIWLSIGTGIFGIVLQWAFLPLIVYRVENMRKYED